MLKKVRTNEDCEIWAENHRSKGTVGQVSHSIPVCLIAAEESCSNPFRQENRINTSSRITVT